MEPASTTRTSASKDPDTGRAPPIVRVLIGLVLAGALYLIAVRHEAILADLANLTAWCF